LVLRDTVQITSSPEKIWPFIKDPERRRSWNPNILTVDPISWGEQSVGYQYRITYVMGKKQSTFLARVTEYRRPEKLVIRHSEGRLPRDGYVDEVYELSQNDGGTFLEQRIEVHTSGINILFRMLIYFILRFGKRNARRYLEKLKELVEISKGQSDSAT
jgi:uncharacterized protein YndB with AHSA1/START domain